MEKPNDGTALMPTYGRFDAELLSGRGANATDEEGKTYIDFGSGIGVNALGYCDEGWVEAVCRQAKTLQHTSNLYSCAVQTAFARELCEAARMNRVFLSNSGAEANECAIKLARKYSFDRYGRGRDTIVTLENSFHGRTITTLSATGQDSFHQSFFPFTPGFVHKPAGDIAAMEQALDGTVCAVLIECVQGEGGVVPLPEVYVKRLRALCDERDVLLMIDEVQTGAGRTGTFLACEQYGVTPDVVTLAKGLGGGLPVGACACVERLAGVLSAGTHGSTFGGNPVVCAAGRYTLGRLTDPAFLEEVRRKGALLRQRLETLPYVREVRGMGMMLGVQLEKGDAKQAAAQCLREGLLILTAKTALRLLPPLTITDAEIDAGLAILEKVLRAL